MKYKLALCFFLLISIAGVAQKTSVECYEKALLLLRDGYLKEALPYLEKAVKLDSTYIEPYLSIAGVYGEMKNYEASVKWYEKIKVKDSVSFQLYNLPYSINLAGLGKFNEALAAVKYFLTIPALSERSVRSALYRKQCYEFAINYAKNHPQAVSFTPVNLGDSVNSIYSEYFPSVSLDDSLLVFTRRGNDRQGEYFYSAKKSGENLKEASLIDGDLNQEPLKGAITISADGEWMIFAGELSNSDHPSYDLYICYNTPKGWSEPQNLGLNINSDYWESGPSLSPDNRILYFASNRPGGYGGSDIYMSIRDANGKWGRAINLGDKINTPGDEQAPFIHSDNQTLYFSSNGLPGYGGSDLFVVRKNWLGLWEAPENLGYPINTIENEGSLAVAADGKTAYYASDRADSRGELDLYTFILPESKRPHKTLYVKGTVSDAHTQKGLPSLVELTEKNSGKVLMQVQTDELGKYLVTLPLGNDYIFTVNRKGYLYYSKIFPLAEKAADSTYEQPIQLQPVAVNQTIVLKNILFGFNSYELLDASKTELEKVWQLLSDNPGMSIEISGHTDNVGSKEDNITLSKNRAKTVVDYLVKKGIPANRLVYKGYGSQKPIADNNTETGRELNRRTELKILEIK